MVDSRDKDPGADPTLSDDDVNVDPGQLPTAVGAAAQPRQVAAAAIESTASDVTENELMEGDGSTVADFNIDEFYANEAAKRAGTGTAVGPMPETDGSTTANSPLGKPSAFATANQTQPPVRTGTKPLDGFLPADRTDSQAAFQPDAAAPTGTAQFPAPGVEASTAKGRAYHASEHTQAEEADDFVPMDSTDDGEVEIPADLVDYDIEALGDGTAVTSEEQNPFPQSGAELSDIQPLTQVTGTYSSPDELPDAFGPTPSQVPSQPQYTVPAGTPSGDTSTGIGAAGSEEVEIVEAEAAPADWDAMGMDIEMDSQVSQEMAPDAPEDELGSNAPTPGSDHWAEFDDKSGWDSVTGQKRMGSRPKSQPRARADGESGKSSPRAPAPAPVAKEYTRQSTDNYGVKGKKPQEGARIVCIRGKEEGQEFSITSKEAGVGRDPRNDIVIEEPSASRMHASIVSDGDKYTLIDNNSGNGTFVNGQRVDRARIRSGDEIGFGNGVYRFLEIGDVFKPVDAKGAPVLPGARRQTAMNFLRGRKAVAASAGIVVASAMAVVTILIIRASSGGPSGEITFRYYMQGIEAFKRRNWPEAENHFKNMLGNDPTHPRAQNYLRAVGEERLAEGRLARAKQARGGGDLATAFSELNAIRDSVYAGEARELLKGINSEVDARVARARTLLDSGQPKDALQLLQTVEQIRPGRPDVRGLMDRAIRASGGVVPTSVQGITNEPSPAPSATPSAARDSPRAASDGGSTASSTGGGNSGGEDPAVKRARELFGSGKLKDAVAALSSAKDAKASKDMSRKIERFKKVYAAALGDHRAKKTGAALGKFKQARVLETSITGGAGPLGKEIQRKTADMHYVEALQLVAKNKYDAAGKSFRQALRVSPGHAPTTKKVNELAKKLYESGYTSQQTDAAGAKKRYKQAMQLSPPGSEYHTKAKKRLSQLK